MSRELDETQELYLPPPPRRQREEPRQSHYWRNTVIFLVLLACAGMLAGSYYLFRGGGLRDLRQVLATSAPVPALSRTPAPQAAPAPRPASSLGLYAESILRAGIAAPATWIAATGQELCSDWRRGETRAQTNRLVLLPGGVRPRHLRAFNDLTSAGLCPRG